jgi:hypothetical protein
VISNQGPMRVQPVRNGNDKLRQALFTGPLTVVIGCQQYRLPLSQCQAAIIVDADVISAPDRLVPRTIFQPHVDRVWHPASIVGQECVMSRLSTQCEYRALFSIYCEAYKKTTALWKARPGQDLTDADGFGGQHGLWALDIPAG